MQRAKDLQHKIRLKLDELCSYMSLDLYICIITTNQVVYGSSERSNRNINMVSKDLKQMKMPKNMAVTITQIELKIKTTTKPSKWPTIKAIATINPC